MYCDNCGEEAKNTDKFCNNCGAKLQYSSNSLKSKEEMKAETFSNSMSKIIKKNKNESSTEFEQNNGNYKSSYRDNKKTKKIPLLLLIIIFLVLSIGVYVFLNKDKLFYSNKGKRTIMIYMIGSDLESKYLAGTKDINEIINSSINYDDINILIYTGGAKKWHNNDIPNDKQALFEINSSGLNKIEEYDATRDMLDSSNISFLLKYGYENYDTEYYDLILWDHGAGPIYGYGYDEYNKIDSISMIELKEALQNSPFNGANKLGFIGFDACLMSSVEVASIVSDYASYMIASQEFEPGSGWNYKFLSEIDSSTSTLEIGKKIIDYYELFYEEKSYIKGISLSLLRLNKVENIEKSLNELFSSVDEDLTDTFSSISRVRSSSKSYGRVSGDYYYYDLVDLTDLINKLPEKYYDKVEDLKSLINDFVVYQKTDLNNTNGVSIYFPYENKKEIVDNMKIYKDLSFADSYYNFISEFSSTLTGKKITEWDLTKNKLVSPGEGKVSISLTKDVIDNYSSADYIIFEKDSNNFFTPIFNGTDVELVDNTLTTTISKKTIVVKEKDSKMYLTAIESMKGVDFVKYYIPATLSKWDSKEFNFDILAVYLEFVVDNDHPLGYIATILPMEVNENYTYSKIEINLKDWDTLTLLSYKYSILDNSGNYTSNWTNSEEVLTMELDANDNIDISFDDLDISKDYYCLFRIRDSQGNIYLSNIVEINNK